MHFLYDLSQNSCKDKWAPIWDSTLKVKHIIHVTLAVLNIIHYDSLEAVSQDVRILSLCGIALRVN